MTEQRRVYSIITRGPETTDRESLIFDWNVVAAIPPRPEHGVEFDDETLRDGLQSPSVIDPPIEKKIEILHLMAELGIQSANIGLPAAGPRARNDVRRRFRLVEKRTQGRDHPLLVGFPESYYLKCLILQRLD